MVIGVLALQGAVSEHCRALDSLQVRNKEVRNIDDVISVDGLIMPGGESTTLRKLLKNTGLWKFIMECELPILGTCAGAILLGKSNDETFQKMDFTVDRNFYGRQLLRDDLLDVVSTLLHMKRPFQDILIKKISFRTSFLELK